jgi:hypothetical protein
MVATNNFPENLTINAGKRFLVRIKRNLTNHNAETTVIHGLSVTDFDIYILEEATNTFRVQVNGQIFWIDKSWIFTYANSERKQGWLIVDLLKWNSTSNNKTDINASSKPATNGKKLTLWEILTPTWLRKSKSN